MEYVTQMEPRLDAEGRPLPGADRLAAALARLGGEVRAGERREAERVFDWLAAAAERLPVGEVRFHECLHDEGPPFEPCVVSRRAW